MQVVIEIDEELYESIKGFVKDGCFNYAESLIASGTVLPKVHGDLIDRNLLLEDFGISEKTHKYGGDHSGYNTLMLYEIQNEIECADTILEAREDGET